MLPTSNGSGCSPLPATQISLDPLRSWSETCSEVLGIMKPWVVCVSMCLWVCLYVCLYVSLWVLVCLWLAMHVYICLCVCFCVCLCVSMCLCVSLCHCGWYICLCDCVSEDLFLCVCLCSCTIAGASLGLTLRRRGYQSMCILQSPEWINGTQLSTPW